MVTCLLAPFGIEVCGIDIGALNDGLTRKLELLIARHRVAVFRDQRINDAAFVRFLHSLGELMFTDGETPVVNTPDLNIVSNIGRSTPPRSVFHTDTSYVARPPAYTALRAVTLPKQGGETVFSDQVAALIALPEWVCEWLAGRCVKHRATGLDGRDESCWQPLMRRHPLTGETALYLSTPERCIELSGVSPLRAKRILTLLYRRSVRGRCCYRHQWQAGDILIWDNRTTMHRADHSDVVGDRVLHRGMVLGERPIAVS